MMSNAIKGFLLSVVVMVGMTQMAQADIGYVDLERIYAGYEKASSVRADIKVKEAELRKLQADYVKQLEESRKANPKNPVGNDMLEKELNEKLNARVNEYRDWVTTKQKEVDQEIRGAIQAIVKSKSIDLVLTSPAIYMGGTDLTNDVLGKINASAPAPVTPAKK